MRLTWARVRAQRIKEFLEENKVPVLGLREGSWLRRRGGELKLGGVAGAVLFLRGPRADGLPTGHRT